MLNDWRTIVRRQLAKRVAKSLLGRIGRGLPGNKLLAAAVEDKADDIRTRRALDQMLVLRGYAQTNYAAKSWKVERRVCARIEATELGLDIHAPTGTVITGQDAMRRFFRAGGSCKDANSNRSPIRHKSKPACAKNCWYICWYKKIC